MVKYAILYSAYLSCYPAKCPDRLLAKIPVAGKHTPQKRQPKASTRGSLDPLAGSRVKTPGAAPRCEDVICGRGTRSAHFWLEKEDDPCSLS